MALSGRLRFQIRAGIAARKAYRTAMFVGTATITYGIANFGAATVRIATSAPTVAAPTGRIGSPVRARRVMAASRCWGRAATGAAGLRVRVPVSISSASSRCATGRIESCATLRNCAENARQTAQAGPGRDPGLTGGPGSQAEATALWFRVEQVRSKLSWRRSARTPQRARFG